MAKGRPENLVPFKKGKDERRNDYGANAGSQSLKAIFEKLLAKEVMTFDGDESIKVTRKEAIALKMVLMAVNNTDQDVQLKAAKMIFDTTDPNAKDILPVQLDIKPVMLNISFRPPEGDSPSGSAPKQKAAKT